MHLASSDNYRHSPRSQGQQYFLKINEIAVFYDHSLILYKYSLMPIQIEASE